MHPDAVFEVPRADVRPAPVNDAIYRPVDPDDPDLRALADSLREHGQLEPVVVTRDNVLLSGHRRYAAAGLAGLAMLKARRFPIDSADPRFESVLVAFNRQRHKSADEVIREELVRVQPDDARRRLVAHRRAAARVRVGTLAIVGTKTRAAISKAKAPLLAAIRKVLDEHLEFWPVSDRRVHYALLNDPPLKHASKSGSAYANDDKSYDALTELLTRARIAGLIPMEAIEDPTRPVVTWDVFHGVGGYVRRELAGFLRGYARDLQRSQPLHVELVAEKNTVDGTLRPVAADYCLPFTVARGYASVPPRWGIVERFRRSGKERLLLLFVSDCDPEGDDIAHSFARSIRDDFGVRGVGAVKVALTRDQARALNLPPVAVAKAGSSRRRAFVERHGDDRVWELEAVPPARLQQILREHVEGVLDMALFRREEEREAEDAAQLEAVRRVVRRLAIDRARTLGVPDDADSDDEDDE